MANPLAIFRKYQKILLVVFGVALMLVFTVGEIISQYMYRGDAASENPVVVTIGSDAMRETDLQSLQFARHHLRNFMQAVNLEAAQAGATPQQNIGISDTDAEADLIQTVILTRRAQEMGMVVSDQAIINFLTRYSQGKLSTGDFARILGAVTQGRMSQNQFFDAMRRELLARQYLAVQQEGMMPPTPAGMWDYFLRLNRQISFEAVPFEVADYLDEVSEPSEEAIAALYEQGKDRYPFPDRAEPGFKRLKQVAIQYVKADLDEFLDEAKAQITQEEIEAYYESNKEEFRHFDLPGVDGTMPPAIPSPADSGTNDAPLPATGDGQPTSESSESELPEANAQPLGEPADEPTPVESSPQAEDPDRERASDSPTDDNAPATPDAEPDPDAEAEAPETGLRLRTDAGAAIVNMPTTVFDTALVAALQEPAASDDQDSAEIESATSDSDRLPAESTEATEGANTQEAVEPQERQATGQPAESSSEQPAEQATEPADGQPAASDEAPDPLGDLPEAAGDNIPARGDFQTLEEATETIRTRLATPIARQKMDQALNVLRSEMKNYASNYLAWEVSGESQTSPAPPLPDLSAVAQQQRLSVGTIPLVTIFDLQANDPVTGEPRYDISRAFDTNLVPFAQYMFSDDLRRYEVRSIRGHLQDTEYLYWKTDEVPEKVQALSEVRDDVVRALKMQQALELAKQAAQKAAEQLNQNRQRPQDVYANDPNRKVIDAESITWMTGTSLPYMPPRPTRIPGIEYAGDEFMQSVFSLPPGKAGVAVDNPHDTVYVVYVNRVDSDEEQLRQHFLLAGPTMETAQLAQRDAQSHLQQWYADLEEELGVKWQRDPRPDSRAR